MTSVQEENGWLQQKVAELEESYQDLGAQFNTTSALLDMDERELANPLCRAREWSWNQAKCIEKSRAWTKKETIHILVLAQHVEKLDQFFEKLETEKGHQTKKLLEDIIDL
ncbi:hypothetical protein V6N11_051784 [Hibiscus sabdariffa]|uniref:Uncharacterized protein n=1 Tax=Hibiscus sabdariffa TaxID=183260 RepID=A0ABR2U830_9ROSI